MVRLECARSGGPSAFSLTPRRATNRVRGLTGHRCPRERRRVQFGRALAGGRSTNHQAAGARRQMWLRVGRMPSTMYSNGAAMMVWLPPSRTIRDGLSAPPAGRLLRSGRPATKSCCIRTGVLDPSRSTSSWEAVCSCRSTATSTSRLFHRAALDSVYAEAWPQGVSAGIADGHPANRLVCSYRSRRDCGRRPTIRRHCLGALLFNRDTNGLKGGAAAGCPRA